MQAVILAGGFGTRISEESHLKPKPMIEIGGKPILWHLMKIYSAHGINEFIICLGYKGYMIKEYFANYFLHTSDVTFDLANNDLHIHQSTVEPWKVTLVDTGLETMTGGRLKRISKYINGDEFCMSYGDGLADVDVSSVIDFHRRKKVLATVTAVQPPGRFGSITLNEDKVASFEEKPAGDKGWINGGFFVLSNKVVDYIKGDSIHWEREPMVRLAAEGQLASYKHSGFWQAMDTLRDRRVLEEAWESGSAAWKKWV